MSNDAWAAGFYEGEGTIGCWAASVTMQVNQQYREPLERLQAIFGGKITETKQTATRKTIYCWYLYGQQPVTHAIMVMWPWLSERRRMQAADALDRSFDKFQLRAARCKNEHWRTLENTRRLASGSIRCKDCDNERRQNAA